MSKEHSADIYDDIKSGIVIVRHGSPPEHRFWAKVDKSGPIHPVHGQCWIWTHAKRGIGYGVFTVNDSSVQAHRFSYATFVGSIADGLCVMHKCDNPACVNPSHLMLGTSQENTKDRVRKRRSAVGARHGRNKLTQDDVLEIKRRYRRGDRKNGRAALARQFGVAPNSISNIMAGKTFSYVGS